MGSILIIKIGAIGDAAMSLAMLPFLRNKYPLARITWVCGKIIAPLIRPLVDEVIEVDEKHLLAGNFFQKIGAMLGLWKQLFRKFDLVLIGHRDRRYRLISLPVRAPIKRSWDRKVPGRYHAREYLRLASGEEGPEGPPLEFPEIQVGPSPLDQPFIAIAPGGAKNVLADDHQRRWPIENYAKVISRLSEEYLIVVTGSKTDEWVLPFLPPGKFINWIGKGGLLELLSLYGAAQLLITHDSGPLHLANLVKCPTLALFGPTLPSELAGSANVLWGGEGLPCRPCYDGKSFAVCKNNLCMKSIEPQAVIDRALMIIVRD